LTDESTTASPYRVTLKGQGQTDPWLTIDGWTDDTFRDRLVPFLPQDMEADAIDSATTPELAAKAAAEWVRALNAQPGISIQRDRPAPQPAAAAPAASSASPAAGQARPGLSTSLKVEDDGNYWIALPYQRNRDVGNRQREHAKQLGARYKPDDAPASIPLTNKGTPERPWCVHQRFVSEENVAELLRLHETGFAEIK
jgi:hypothetical protein